MVENSLKKKHEGKEIAVMTPEQLQEAVMKGAKPKDKPKYREIVIVTDGDKWEITKFESSHLEFKQICHEIIKKLGD